MLRAEAGEFWWAGGRCRHGQGGQAAADTHPPRDLLQPARYVDMHSLHLDVRVALTGTLRSLLAARAELPPVDAITALDPLLLCWLHEPHLIGATDGVKSYCLHVRCLVMHQQA